MTQASYSCEGPQPVSTVTPIGGGFVPAIGLFGGPDFLPDLADHARRAGLMVRNRRPLCEGLEDDGSGLGDVCILDCRALDAASLPALVALDDAARRCGVEILAITDRASLDDAFGCFNSARVQCLVDAGEGEIIVALGTAVARLTGNRMRELDEADRMTMLRLTQEVGRLAAKLDRMALPLGADTPEAMSSRLASPGNGYRAEGEGDKLRKPRVPLPDPRLIKRIVRQRRLRARYFESELFADPAWDILLDLTAARAEHRRVSVTSLCIAAAVPATTALRWITQMTEMGLLLREQDPEDRRRVFIVLSDPVADAMARYFDELGKDADRLI